MKRGGEVSLTKLVSSVGESWGEMSRISSERGLFSLIAGIIDERRDMTNRVAIKQGHFSGHSLTFYAPKNMEIIYFSKGFLQIFHFDFRTFKGP